jgi:hypothetical protein
VLVVWGCKVRIVFMRQLLGPPKGRFAQNGRKTPAVIAVDRQNQQNLAEWAVKCVMCNDSEYFVH